MSPARCGQGGGLVVAVAAAGWRRRMPMTVHQCSAALLIITMLALADPAKASVMHLRGGGDWRIFKSKGRASASRAAEAAASLPFTTTSGAARDGSAGAERDSLDGVEREMEKLLMNQNEASLADAGVSGSWGSALGGIPEGKGKTPSTSKKTQGNQDSTVVFQAEEEGGETDDGAVDLEYVAVDALENHTATIIWLHGHGDTAEHFEELPSALAAPWCRWVFPEAPLTLDSASGADQQETRVWFEDGSGGDGVGTKGAVGFGLSESIMSIRRLIRDETKNGIPARRIILAGFGQGGVVAALTAVTNAQALGGLLVMSSWFPRGTSVRASSSSRKLPALVCHGRADPLVPVKAGKECCERLATLGLHANFREYSLMAHDFCPAEMKDIIAFINTWTPREDRVHSAGSNPFQREGASKRRMDGGVRKLRTWHDRYLVLRDNVLTSYKSTSMSKVMEVHDLSRCRVLASDKKRPGRTLCIESDGEGPISFFHFDAEEERDQWLQALSSSEDWEEAERERRRLRTTTPQPEGTERSDDGTRRRSVLRRLATSCFNEQGSWGSFDDEAGGGGLQGGCFGGRQGGRRGRRRPLRKPVWENLVFSGGGVKVLAFPSALATIADHVGEDGRSLRWVKRVAGVSGGSIIATAVACGCSVDDVVETSQEFDVEQIADSMSGTGPIQTMRRLLSNYGVFDGNILAIKVDEVIHKHTGMQGATFQQLYDHTGILLKIFATSLRNGELIEFSAQKTPNDQVAMAARCSMSVPFLFDAVPTSEGDLLVDAALVDNCPVWCFDDKPISGGDARENPKTLAFWVATRDTPQHAAPKSVRGFCMRMIDLVLFMQQRVQKQSFNDDDRICWVQSPDIPISTFRLEPSCEAILHRCGRSSARHFIRGEKFDPTQHAEGDAKKKKKKGGVDDEGSYNEHKGAHTEWVKERSAQTAVERFVRYWLSDRKRSAPLLQSIRQTEEGGSVSVKFTRMGNVLSSGQALNLSPKASTRQ